MEISQNTKNRAQEMALQLKVLAVLAEDPYLICSTHVRQLFSQVSHLIRPKCVFMIQNNASCMAKNVKNLPKTLMLVFVYQYAV